MMQSRTIKIATTQAQNSDFVIEQIAAYIGKTLGMPTEFISDIPWQERDRLLDIGNVDIGWICGLPYVLKLTKGFPTLNCWLHR